MKKPEIDRIMINQAINNSPFEKVVEYGDKCEQEKFYEIRVESHLNSSRSEWFCGMSVKNLDNGQAVISGIVEDQCALFGILDRIRDMNLKLVSVTRKVNYE